MFLTVRLGRLVTNAIQHRLEEADRYMIGPNMGILVDLMREDGVRQQDLAVSSIRDKATITRSILSLEQQGFVRRVADAQDKRTKRIFITTGGREFFQRILPVGQSIADAAKAGMDAEELEVCTHVLKKMYDNLNHSMLVAKAEAHK